MTILSLFFFVVMQLAMVLSEGEEEPLLLPSPVEKIPKIPVLQAINSLEKVVEETMIIEKFCNKYYGTTRNDCRTDSSATYWKPKDCASLYHEGISKSGVYSIYLRPSWMTEIESKVYCNMETDGGGWTVIQRRGDFKTDPPVNFTRKWQDYSKGFGNLEEEFWLGNENIHRLTSQDNVTLRVDLMDFEGNTAYAKYDSFEIGGYKDDYILKVDRYSGTGGDSMNDHNERKFVTYDHNDEKNCAKKYKGGWWYHKCHQSNLNGFNFKFEKETSEGITWYHWKSKHVSIKGVEMKIRPKNFSY